MSPLRGAIEALLGEAVSELSAVAGGDIAESFRVTLSTGDLLFAKFYRNASPGVVRCEAEGLSWLGEGAALRVPRVRGVAPEDRLLVLDWIEEGRPDHATDEVLGRGLAALHQHGAPRFGFVHDNFIGPLPQSNRSHDSWPAFYGAERITPQIRLARDAGLLSYADMGLAERLIDQLPERCGPTEPPARLHGDLWSGNVLIDSASEPWLIDPAVHGGHREVDLAMMRLFGGFSQRVFDAYAERQPLAPDAADRVDLYHLYPLLVHVNLFGGSYVASVRRILQALS